MNSKQKQLRNVKFLEQTVEQDSATLPRVKWAKGSLNGPILNLCYIYVHKYAEVRMQTKFREK